LGFIVAIGLLLALGRWYPGSGAEQVDWRPTRSPEVEAELELDDVDQMLEAQNARRRASGRPERTEEDISMQVQEDRQFIDDYAERVKREEEERGDST
jgi:ribosome-binding protein aMBF1 (putative translation factor)